MAIVKTNINYTYDIMISNIYELNTLYPFLQVQIEGFSVLGKPIPAIRLGHGSKQVFYAGSFHANEWITSVLLMSIILCFLGIKLGICLILVLSILCLW